MRTPEEMQRAHDILHAVLMGEVPIAGSYDANVAWHSAHDVLAWVFGWPCGDAFARNLIAVERAVIEQGFELVKRHDGN